ncbi:MAG: TRAP transporter small permease [Betaproteobacteria bacterium]|nr:TRAP transporter small permease [Betaproteobacteria bacterium]
MTRGAAAALAARILGAAADGALALSAIGVLVSFALIAWSVVMRYVFNQAPVWVDDVVGFMLVGIVMLGAAQVLRRGDHIGVDLLTSRLPPRARRWADAWSSLAVLAVSLILMVNGWRTAMFARQLGIVAEGRVEIPVFWLQLLLPLGGLLMALVALEALARLAAGAPPLAAPREPAERPQ